MLKVVIASVIIGVMEMITKFKNDDDKRCFEIAMSILMTGWIMREGW